MKKDIMLSIAGIGVDILFLLAFEAKKDRNVKPSERSAEQAKQIIGNDHLPMLPSKY